MEAHNLTIDAETHDRFKALAADRGISVRAYLAELAVREEQGRSLGRPGAARLITIEIDEEFLADVRAVFNAGTDEEAVKAAVVDAAKRLRRREFFEAIDSGEIDFTHDART